MHETPEGSYAPEMVDALEDRHAVPKSPPLVRANLRALGHDLAAAVAASDHENWAATLDAVRMMHGRTVVARQDLERMLGSHAATYMPPLVRAVQVVGRVIAEREIDCLPPNELRARMHAVLQILNREMKALLSPLDE